MINLLIEGSLISAIGNVLPKGPLGATRIHSYTRMASWIRMRLSDLYMQLSVRKPLGTAVPQDENLPTCAPSGLEPPTYQILGRQQ